jgi:hypothetical protein
MTNDRAMTRPWDRNEEDRPSTLLEQGKNAAEIAAVLGRTRHAIYTRVQRLYRNLQEVAGPPWIWISGAESHGQAEFGKNARWLPSC